MENSDKQQRKVDYTQNLLCLAAYAYPAEPAGTCVQQKTSSPQPLITVILTAFDCVKYMSLSIGSILRQSWNNIELIVVDDFSSSPYRKPLYQYLHAVVQKDQRVRVIASKINRGCYASKNIGLSLKKGTYVTFQDIDDFSCNNRLVLQYITCNAASILSALARHSKITMQRKSELVRLLYTDIISKSIFIAKLHGATDLTATATEASRVRYGHKLQHQEHLHKVLGLSERTNLQEAVNSDISYGVYASRNPPPTTIARQQALLYQQYHQRSTYHETQLQTLTNIQCGKYRLAEITMFARAHTFDKYLGAFDDVRFAADSEIRLRIQALGIPTVCLNHCIYHCIDKWVDIYGARAVSLTMGTNNIGTGCQSETRKKYIADAKNKIQEQINAVSIFHDNILKYPNRSAHDVSSFREIVL